MKVIEGDLIVLGEQGKFDVIVHGCNCFCTMGAGIAKTIKQKFPEAYKEDLRTEKGDKSKLGDISWVTVNKSGVELTIVNAYTQYDYRGKGVKVDYEAIRSAFRKIRNNFSGQRIGYPAIGAGLARGDWQIISKIINEELEGEDHTYVIFRNDQRLHDMSKLKIAGSYIQYDDGYDKDNVKKEDIDMAINALDDDHDSFWVCIQSSDNKEYTLKLESNLILCYQSDVESTMKQVANLEEAKQYFEIFLDGDIHSLKLKFQA